MRQQQQPQQMMMQNANSMPQPAMTEAQAAQHQPMQKYSLQLASLINSPQFKNASERDRRQLIGTMIFDYVIGFTTEVYAPKITGMIIELPYEQLKTSIQSFQTLRLKSQEAL